jgi:serine/threonine protein kinase/Tol biopolymer transport system component
MDEPETGPEIDAVEWESIKELVFECQTQEPVDLNAWLTAHCPSGKIRQEVERLVRAAASSGDFLQGRASERYFGVGRQHPVRIGRYRIIEELGSGGLAVVYAAYDDSLERVVAIKVLASDTADEPERRKRLRWDAKAAGALKHPNIVVIHDIGTDAGFDYVVMERVDGRPLGQLIAPGGMAIVDVLAYAIQIADALEFAHRAGIVHRDLKPNNIMITEQGVVKLLDFGLAKHCDPSIQHSSLPATIEGHFAGTVAYVAPEQAEGKTVDARADIFSFGCILFEMLTGRQAFQGRSAVSVLANILHQNPPPVREFNPQLDPRLDAIVQRCLQKEADDRFQTIADAKLQLAALVPAAAPRAAPASLTRWLWNRWALVAVMAALFVTALATTTIAIRRWRMSPPPPESPFALTKLTTDAGLTAFPAISRDGKLLAFASDRGGQADLELWVQHLSGAEPLRLTYNPADDYAPVFSPDGARIVYRSDRAGGGLYSISSLGGEERLLVPEGRGAQFSPDGQWLAYWKGEIGGSLYPGSARIFVMPASGGPAQEFVPGLDAAASPVWAPSGQRLLFLARGKDGNTTKVDWWIADLHGRSARPTGLLAALANARLNRPAGAYWATPAAWLGDDTVVFAAKHGDATNIWGVGVSRDGNMLERPFRLSGGTALESHPNATETSNHVSRLVYAALTVTTAIWRIPLTTRGDAAAAPERLITGFADINSPAVSADGNKLVFAARELAGQVMHLIDLGNTQKGVTSSIHATRAERPVLSGDGSTVAYLADGNGYVVPAQGGVAERVCFGCGPPTHLTWNGAEALFESGGLPERLLRCARGEKQRLLVNVPGAQQIMQSAGRFSPDHRWVVYCGSTASSTTSQIFVAPVTSDGLVPEAQLAPVTEGASIDREPFWSPGGQRIYFLSNRDGFECVWARNVDRASARPSGPVFPVAHFHHSGQVIRGPTPYPGLIGLSVAEHFLVLTVSETTGNVWLRSGPIR